MVDNIQGRMISTMSSKMCHELPVEAGRHFVMILSSPSARNGGGERLDMIAGEIALLHPFFRRGGNGTRDASSFG